MTAWPGLIRDGSGVTALGPVRARMGTNEPVADPVAERDLRLARQCDPEAFTRLVARYQREIGRLLWKFCRQPAEHEDLLQQVFVNAWVAMPTYRGRGRFENWLRKLAVRTAVDGWRKQRRERVDFTDTVEPVADAAGHVPDPADAVAAAELVHGLLAQLSDRDRAVLTLLHLEGCDVAETAALLGWSKSLVKVQAHRARARLRKLMPGEDV